MKTEIDPATNTIMMIEEYEFQANIMAGMQSASNRLYKLRVDMHKKIHELLEKEECEFCFKEVT